MKSFIKMVSVLLIMLLCLGMLGTSVLAAPFSCQMLLNTCVSDETVVVRVTTDRAAGAVCGKLTFDSELLTFDPEHTVCYESAVEVEDICTVEGNTIAFAIAADDMANGDTKWIDFAFTVKNNGVAAFSVSDALASDVNENLSQTIAVSPVSIYVGNRIIDFELTSEDRIGVDLSVYVDDVANTQVKITVAGKESIINTSDANPKGDDIYVFSANVAAAQMTDSIEVEVVANGEVIESSSYTIRRFAEYVLGNSLLKKEKALARAMLNYGGKAQLYFNYNTKSLADTDITIAEADIPQTAEPYSVTGKLDDLEFYGASLVFQSKPAMRFYFKGDTENCSFKAGEEVLTPVEKDGLWYVEVADINPQELDKPVTLTVNDTLVVTYSPLNYIVHMNEKGSDTLVALLKAMYTYHLAAVDYMK